MVAHCLDDDFATLLDKSQYVPVHEGRGPQARHRFYNEYARHASPIFNHRNPAMGEDYEYLERCIARFRRAAQSTRNLFVLIHVSDENNASNFDALAAAFRRSVKGRLLHAVYRLDDNPAGSVQTIREAACGKLVELRTGTEPMFGTRFADPADDELLRRVIRNAAEKPTAYRPT